MILTPPILQPLAEVVYVVRVLRMNVDLINIRVFRAEFRRQRVNCSTASKEIAPGMHAYDYIHAVRIAGVHFENNLSANLQRRPAIYVYRCAYAVWYIYSATEQAAIKMNFLQKQPTEQAIKRGFFLDHFLYRLAVNWFMLAAV